MLHCTLMGPANPHKFIYHLSDGPRCMTQQWLMLYMWHFWLWRNTQWNCVNAPQQYKNKYSFGLTQKLADNYNCKIVRVFGAGGHGKGIIDAMSAFGVKGILRRDIAGLELWWKDRHDICEYLKGKEDDRMLYCHVPQHNISRKQERCKWTSISRLYEKNHVCFILQIIKSL